MELVLPGLWLQSQVSVYIHVRPDTLQRFLKKPPKTNEQSNQYIVIQGFSVISSEKRGQTRRLTGLWSLRSREATDSNVSGKHVTTN